MRILVTGSKGFVGKNLLAELKERGYTQICEYDIDIDEAILDEYTRDCDFVFHLAGVNRPQQQSEFDTGNREFTVKLLGYLKKHKNNCPIVYSSSIQAEMDNPYGNSKKAAENELFAFAEAKDTRVMVYRLPNLFGKWCQPNYNSVVATFCYNIANDYDITINDPNIELTLCYIDDVINEFCNALKGLENRDGQFCYVAKTYKEKLGEIADKLFNFKQETELKLKQSFDNDFDSMLFSTYISYLPGNNGIY